MNKSIFYKISSVIKVILQIIQYILILFGVYYSIMYTGYNTSGTVPHNMGLLLLMCCLISYARNIYVGYHNDTKIAYLQDELNNLTSKS